MYIPGHFKISNDEEISNFIGANTFGQLVSTLDGKLLATHMPFLFSPGQRCLRGHLAKANPQWQQLDGQEVLVTFQGPHAYISPSWYHKSGVPTWNYQAVHIYGTAACFSEPEKLGQIVNSLTEANETSLEIPWQAKYESKMLGGIVGIEIAIQEIQCKFKLSQNRDREEQINVCEQLRASGELELAQAMSKVFSIS